MIDSRERLRLQPLAVSDNVPKICRRHRRDPVAAMTLEFGEAFRGEPSERLADRRHARVGQFLQLAETKFVPGLELSRMHRFTNSRIGLVGQGTGNVANRNHG